MASPTLVSGFSRPAVTPVDGTTRLLGVFAHPDDDVYTLGGSLVLERDRLEVTLVFCTSGDAGPIWIGARG
jgi:LmbE family N-acetylglucosaminyl deacetylase